MDPTTLAIAVLVGLLILLFLRVPIAFALCAVSIIGMFFIFAWPPGGAFNPARAMRPVQAFLGTDPFSFIKTYTFTMVPLFIVLGHVAHKARFTTDLFYAIRILLPRLPGGLAIASVIGCAGFSSISGSSMACASAMGRIAVPEMLKFGYSKPLATASVAAGGTLGSLIPPSLVLVLYGVFTEQSIGKLFVAGILPGIVSVLAYVILILMWVKIRPGAAPENHITTTTGEQIKALLNTWPIAVIAIVVIGGIYSGFLTATESAAAATAITILIGFGLKRLDWEGFCEALRETSFQCAVIFVLAIGAKLMVSFVGITNIASDLVAWTNAQNFSPALVLLMICVLYLVLGTFLDAIGILLLTLPLAIPIIENLGYDLIWFGIVIVKLIEVGLVTPPVGINVFVIKSVVGDAVPINQIFKGAALFILADLVVLYLIINFEEISLFLPNTMF
ncbi:MAG: C4-dicarboxylate ABC transporter permease [Sneathiella sp.]|jgi:tripartite ATP-independent transporter DctM subunit|uniref:TRAP transporter large permease n=1 Tax=Sneathiella sp. TaxID=1964365 RepID=UPI000C53317A|nr:TRAP transporter large permease [Sneathiella sp.]MAL77890.1 C4-dicarboxylate ABC transporter permease [Sneathiella sp.]